MFAISTCWKSCNAESGDDILGPIADAGVAAVELEYRITEKIFREILPALKRGEPGVVSVHNFFPLPSILTRDQASGDAFLLSSPEREERELAIRYTLRTLEWAHELGAKAVVLHLGRTDMDDHFSRLKEDAKEGNHRDSSSEKFIRDLLEEREKAGSKHLDAALFSLDKLWRPAERFAVKLGIENRYHLHEVPTSDELSVIFERFEGSNVAYWHDVGHAAVQEFLYGIEHESLLSRFSSCLLGVHIHDAEDTRDHQAPGRGKIDFGMIRKYLTASTFRVIEVGPDVNEEELREGIGFLSRNELLSD